MNQLSSSSISSRPGCRQRYAVLDVLRGFLFLNMVAYHFLYDWVYIFGQSFPFMRTHTAYLWQQIVCGGFILLAGFCCTLSRNPARNGMRIFLCGLMVTIVTWIVTPQEKILFGILHFMGLAYLITAFLQPILKKCPGFVLFLTALSLFAFTRGIYYGYLGFFQHPVIPLPDSLYQYPFLFPLGLPDSGFASSDYFPLIPWLFLFWTGYAVAPSILSSSLFHRIQHWHLPVCNWIGQHTLILYMLHQPLIFGVLSLIFC